MSLINDALKRVKAAQQQAPPSASVDLHFRPVETAPSAGRGAGWWFPFVFAVVAVFGLIFAWQLLHHGEVAVRAVAPSPGYAHDSLQQPQAAASNPALEASHAPNSSAATAPTLSEPSANRRLSHPAEAAAERTPAPVRTAQATVSSAGTNAESNRGDAVVLSAPADTNQSAISSSTNSVTTRLEPLPPKPPLLKLQGIIFDPRRPSAVINGRTLFIGDRLRGMRVVSITSETATLTGGGRTNVLSLAE
jgi:hypothetical protein